DYNMQATYFSKLSGGEKRKIYLLSVLIENPNFLILDEPTNDLDIFTLSALEEYLINFEGCLIIVSHDRRFLNNLVEHLFIFEGDGKIKDYYGYITDYRQIMISHNKSATKPNIKKIVLKQNKNQNKLTYKEQQELKFLENEIKKLEKEQSEILNSMNSGQTDSKNLPNLALKYEEMTNILEKNTERWLKLSIKFENSEK
ncbi:ATP-binding cassette domain-containing protein, partial [bacterium]|nr:ATP-binding cassette domain-containing protein [bacterium]